MANKDFICLECFEQIANERGIRPLAEAEIYCPVCEKWTKKFLYLNYYLKEKENEEKENEEKEN